jgi:predicted phage baseplate assembly protein
MPLRDHLPQIDDRRYDDIVTEIRTRVARYAPEWRPGESAWTDVNENDPGITLAQVFAWQADMLLYRLNKVPELSYIKFLELIGIELTPAQPAWAEVFFPVAATHAAPIVRVPARAQLTADPQDGGPPVVFETVRGIVAFRAALKSVMVFDGSQYASRTTENGAADRGFEPFGPRPDQDAALLLGFDDSAALPPEILDLAFVVMPGDTVRQYVPCGGNPLSFAPASIAWEYQTPTGWSRLNVLKDDTLALTRSGHVSLRLPAAGIGAKTKLQPADPLPFYWLRARLVTSQYERAPRILAVRTNTGAVEAAETLSDEVLGGSDGSRNQVFQMAGKPVVNGSLLLDIEESDRGFERWTEVADFFGSGPADPHYVLNRSTGEVFTGDGVHGAIPVAYVNNPNGNVIARQYRVGGGKRGNVPAGAIATMAYRVDGIDENGIGNLQPAFAGSEEETLDEARKRAPRSIRSRDRAVTAADFETLAQAAGNVRRAKALPLFHPDFPADKIPGVVSVVVVPDADVPMPMPSEGTLRSVCAYLDERRLLTTELYVVKPGYQQIAVHGDVVVANDADLAEVADAIDAQLVRYFHPLQGGEDGQGWPFGGKLYYSRIYQRVFGVPGVASITRLVLVLDGIEQAECTDVPIAAHGLLYSGQHQVTVHYSFDDGFDGGAA